DKKTKARVGLLKTKSGTIETPFFMPVATKASVKYMSSEDLKEAKVKAVISNTFILHLKPGEAIIKELGGIKKFMNFSGINATDSGGYQMYSPSTYLKSNDQGVFFKNPFSGERIFLTPEKDMQIQLDLGSDIAMCLDRMPLFSDSKQEIEKAVNLTSKWAERCKKEHTRIQSKLKDSQKQLLFAISQGGLHMDLRKKSCEQLKELDFAGYAIGGIALNKPEPIEQKIIDLHKTIISETKPCYLMGAGEPIQVLDAISRGVDFLDSKYPAEIARRGTILTSKGKLKILNSQYKLDKKPLDENCDCKVCKNYTRAYVRYQLLIDENTGIGKHLATFHNIYFMMKLLEDSKKAIKLGKFKAFFDKMKRVYKS
ncbi:MAG: tRNA guanosine(34) transglycosylase Tgt, partial [Nanoarchaeota archaeon]